MGVKIHPLPQDTRQQRERAGVRAGVRPTGADKGEGHPNYLPYRMYIYI